MSVTLNYTTNLTVKETITAGVPDALAASAVVTHDQFNKSVSLNGATTPPVSVTASFVKALVSGAGTIDLTALPGTNGATISGTGLKVQALKVQALGTNANPITLTFGASNPYALHGATFVMALSPGQEYQFFGNAATPTIGSGAKNIDLSGTGTQSLNVQVVMG